MFWFIFLIILFVLALAFFLVYPKVRRNYLEKNFNAVCARKASKISKKRNFYYLENVNILDFQYKKFDIDQILFGRKYIYVISNSLLLGEVNGNMNDHSWTFKKYGNKDKIYIDNIIEAADDKISKFTSLIGIKKEFVISICVIPNECDFLVNKVNKDNSVIIRSKSFYKMIDKIESRNIDPFNKGQLKDYYEMVKARNGK